jgi:opacity protein-like surface antigen
MKQSIQSILTRSLVLSAFLNVAQGGTTESPVVETPTPVSPWSFEASVYGWFTGLDGDIGIGRFDVGFDESFLDIVDDLNMAAMLRFETRCDKWGIIADGFYVDLGTSGTPPGPLYSSASVDLRQFMGELTVAYRISECPSGFVDIYGGARYNSLSVDLSGDLDPAGIQASGKFKGPIADKLKNLPTQKSADQDWLDPIVGIRAQWNINNTWFIAGKSDIGGFNVGSELAWTLQATAGYHFTRNVSAELGYRYLHTDYSEGALNYDVAQAGIYTSLNIKF